MFLNRIKEPFIFLTIYAKVNPLLTRKNIFGIHLRSKVYLARICIVLHYLDTTRTNGSERVPFPSVSIEEIEIFDMKLQT